MTCIHDYFIHQGPMGGLGEPGPMGKPGPRGQRGLTGQPGSPGRTGVMGPAGMPGRTGDLGEDGRRGVAGVMGPPGEAGPAAHFSPQAMMMMFRQPGGNNKGVMGDAPAKDDVIEITKTIESKFLELDAARSWAVSDKISTYL